MAAFQWTSTSSTLAAARDIAGRQQKGAARAPFQRSLVRVAGLEPARLTPTDFKSAVYTNSTTLARLLARFMAARPRQSGALYNPLL